MIIRTACKVVGGMNGGGFPIPGARIEVDEVVGDSVCMD